MSQMLEQFLDGDTEGAWEQARNLGPAAFSDDYSSDVRALAIETARRVDRNVDRLISQLDHLQFRFAEPERAHVRPVRNVSDRLRQLESSLGTLIGEPAPVPTILWVLAEYVGEVVLLGSAERWSPPTYQFDDLEPGVSATYADPLAIFVLSGLELAEGDFADPSYLEQQAGDGMPPELLIAPDRFHKANHSGGSQTIDWPSWSPDPILRDANRRGQPKLTVVQYLRESFEWGGFPGFADYPDSAPTADIEFLAADLEPI